jgi:hypothetical protein
LPAPSFRKPEATNSPCKSEGLIMIKTLSKTSLLFAAVVAVSALVGAAAPARAAAERCITAAQCKGPLPFICMFCASTDKYGCAHHVCINHTCQVQICPGFKPYTPW